MSSDRPSGARGRQSLVSAAFGAILAAHLTLFTPLTLYLGNSNEFTADFSSMLPYLLRFLLLFSVLAALVGSLLSPKGGRVYILLLATLGLMAWVQSNFLVWDYGPLNGRQIDWSQATWRGWLDLLIWILAIYFAVRLAGQAGRVLLNVAVAIFALQIVTSLVLAASNAAEIKRAAAAMPNDDALAQLYDFSATHNVLHLVMDGFQADIFEELVNESERGELVGEAFSGFTFYRNNVSAFPYTHMSLPALISGKIYKNQVPIKEFRRSAFAEDSILKAVQDAGYELDIAAMEVLANWYKMGGYTNSFDVNNSLHVDALQAVVDESAHMLDLSLFRVTPHFVKRFIYNQQRWRVQPLVSNSETNQLMYFSHRHFLRRWHDSMTATREAPVYKMLHLMLSHNPMVVNEGCEYAGRVLYAQRENVLNQSRCSLQEAARILRKMKSLGIYDNSLIVIMGDHGAWVRPKGLKVETDADGNAKSSLMRSSQHALSLPLLAIKTPGADGPLRTSNIPTWTADVPDTISASLNLGVDFGRSNILALSADEQRARSFHFYEYRRGELDAEYLPPIQEYVVEGDVYDTSSWRLGKSYNVESMRK